METKSCLVCFETIDARARKCHHCREVQTKAAAWAHHPAVVTSFLVLVGLLLVWLAYSVTRKVEQPAFVGKLVVGTSTLKVSKAEGQARLSCFAPVKNSDSGTWSGASLQAEFLDAQGKVIDVHHGRGDFKLFPGLQATARVSGSANAASEEYSSCRVTILNAVAN